MAANPVGSGAVGEFAVGEVAPDVKPAVAVGRGLTQSVLIKPRVLAK